MTRNAEIEKALLDVLQIATADGYGITSDAPRIDRVRAALALPEDSKTVNAELYGLAVELADQTARVTTAMRNGRGSPKILRYLELREASGEPMPYKVVREGDKVRFE